KNGTVSLSTDNGKTWTILAEGKPLVVATSVPQETTGEGENGEAPRGARGTHTERQILSIRSQVMAKGRLTVVDPREVNAVIKDNQARINQTLQVNGYNPRAPPAVDRIEILKVRLAKNHFGAAIVMIDGKLVLLITVLTSQDAASFISNDTLIHEVFEYALVGQTPNPHQEAIRLNGEAIVGAENVIDKSETKETLAPADEAILEEFRTQVQTILTGGHILTDDYLVTAAVALDGEQSLRRGINIIIHSARSSSTKKKVVEHNTMALVRGVTQSAQRMAEQFARQHGIEPFGVNVILVCDCRWVEERNGRLFLNHGLIIEEEEPGIIQLKLLSFSKEQPEVHYVFLRGKRTGKENILTSLVPVSAQGGFTNLSYHKGVSNSIMAAAGVRVPEGICFVTPQAYANQDNLYSQFRRNSRLRMRIVTKREYYNKGRLWDAITKEVRRFVNNHRGRVSVKPTNESHGNGFMSFEVSDPSDKNNIWQIVEYIIFLMSRGHDVMLEEFIKTGGHSMRALVVLGEDRQTPTNNLPDLAGVDVLYDYENGAPYLLEMNTYNSGGMWDLAENPDAFREAQRLWDALASRAIERGAKYRYSLKGKSLPQPAAPRKGFLSRVFSLVPFFGRSKKIKVILGAIGVRTSASGKDDGCAVNIARGATVKSTGEYLKERGLRAEDMRKIEEAALAGYRAIYAVAITLPHSEDTRLPYRVEPDRWIAIRRVRREIKAAGSIKVNANVADINAFLASNHQRMTVLLSAEGFKARLPGAIDSMETLPVRWRENHFGLAIMNIKGKIVLLRSVLLNNRRVAPLSEADVAKEVFSFALIDQTDKPEQKAQELAKKLFDSTHEPKEFPFQKQSKKRTISLATSRERVRDMVASSAVDGDLNNNKLSSSSIRTSPLFSSEVREMLRNLRSPYRSLARRITSHMSLMSGIRARKIDKHIVQLTRLENRLLTDFLPEKRTEIEAKIARIKAYLKNYEKQLNQLSQQSDISNDDWA
ncbi:MAG: hypothetical protein WC357_09275, partial [Candidatus Omnitrophota bacterium]